MSVFARHSWLRWLVPAGLTVVVIGGGAAARAVTASADPTLPQRSAAQLLVDLQNSKVNGVSGTVVQRADLGMPSLPSLGGQGSTDFSALLTGSHTLRVWYSGPDKARIALLGTLGETDLIKNGPDVWTWDSQQNTATHQRMQGHSTDQRTAPVSPSAMPSSPQEVADLALRAIDPTTVVTTAGSAKVAGRPAYELVLAPRDTTSLVAQVRIAVDAKEYVPLRTQVYARGADSPAFEAAFTQVNFDRPDDAQFRFNPPAGAKVEEQSTAPSGASTSEPRSAVIGTGWTSVIVIRSPETGPTAGSAQGSQESAELSRLLGALPKVSGSWGSGSVLSGKIFSALLTDDGRLLVGAVSQERLTQVAADPAAALKAAK